MKNIITAFCILMILASCTSTRPERIQQRKDKKCEAAAAKWGCNQGGSDSIMIVRETKTVTRDTTIYVNIPGENKTDTLTIEIGNNGLLFSKKSTLYTSFAESSAWVENGKLRHELTQKDSTIVAKIKDAIRITQINESKKHVTQKPPVSINYNTGWQKIMITGGYVLFIAVVLAIGMAVFQLVRYLKSI